MLYDNDRLQLRQVFFNAWRQHCQARALQGIEKIIVDVALRHPEYHALLANPEQQAQQDYFPETGQSNPFLHMGMHITLEEQLAIDRPMGIREIYQQLCKRYADEHEAQHHMMDCLGQTLWQAQRKQLPPDENDYLSCLRLLCGQK